MTCQGTCKSLSIYTSQARTRALLQRIKNLLKLLPAAHPYSATLGGTSVVAVSLAIVQVCEDLPSAAVASAFVNGNSLSLIVAPVH